jgi:hypothetical protein
MKRRILVFASITVFAVAGLSAGAAFAYFSSAGNGHASATVGSAQTVTVQAVASGSPSSTLVPGGSADLVIQVQNSNSVAVNIASIAQNGAGTVVGGSGCTTSNDGVTVPTQSGLSISVAPGTQVLHVSNGASMASTSASGCQGATFEIPVTLTVQEP